MFIHDLLEQQERRLVVVYPGRFQPFHLGHLAVFQQLQGRFGRDNVFVGFCSAPRKKESKGDPKYFSGTETRMFMHAVGINDDQIKDINGVNNNYMYGAAGWSEVVPFDPTNTVLILAIGAPDANSLELDAVYTEFTPTGKKSRIPPGKTVGDEKPLKTLPDNLAECTTADQFSYVVVVPEVHKQINIDGTPVDVSHGRLVRSVWNRVRKNPKQRTELLTQMFGRNDPELGRILDKIPSDVVKESQNIFKNQSLAENDDDLFATGRHQKWTRAVKGSLDDLYDHYERTLSDHDPGQAELIQQVMGDLDFLRSELGRGGLPAFINGLDVVEINTLEVLDADLAVRHKVYLNDIEEAFINSLDESDDELFSDRRGSQWQQIGWILNDELKSGIENNWFSNSEIPVIKSIIEKFKNNKPHAAMEEIERGGWDNWFNEVCYKHGIGFSLNETDDDLFASSKRVPDEIKRAKHPFADLGVEYDDYEYFVDLLAHCVGLVNVNPQDSEEMAEIFMWKLGQRYGGQHVYDVIEYAIAGHTDISGITDTNIKQLHDALIADHRRGYLAPKDAIAKLQGILDSAMYEVETASRESHTK